MRTVRDCATKIEQYDGRLARRAIIPLSERVLSSVFLLSKHSLVAQRGCLSHETGMIMVFKPIHAARASWRLLDGQNQLPKLITGVRVADGIEANQTPAAA